MRKPLACAPCLWLLLSTALLSACASQQYDQAREWRLRQCEKLLYEKDQRDCKRNTPDYL